METLYNRFAKHKVGWKSGSHKKLEIERFIQEITESTGIYLENNLNIANDMTNANW